MSGLHGKFFVLRQGQSADRKGTDGQTARWDRLQLINYTMTYDAMKPPAPVTHIFNLDGQYGSNGYLASFEEAS